jgi:hypothetical protein
LRLHHHGEPEREIVPERLAGERPLIFADARAGRGPQRRTEHAELEEQPELARDLALADICVRVSRGERESAEHRKAGAAERALRHERRAHDQREIAERGRR